MSLSTATKQAMVWAIAFDGIGNLFAGGLFDAAGGVAANNIAKWDGVSWVALGSGLSGGNFIVNRYVNDVFAAVVDDSGYLYAGGVFTVAGGTDANHIARWNGNSWNALGSGIDMWNDRNGGAVYSLAEDGSGNLFVGGAFNTAGGVAADNIARWDGNTWSALGSGINNVVYALTLNDSGTLYAGGSFTIAGGTAANAIAQWDGSTWSALGSGTNGTIRALAINGSGNLYAGGNFSITDMIGSNNICQWDGSAWDILGSGTNANVLALAADGANNLCAGGEFTIAGGKVSAYIAQCKLHSSSVNTFDYDKSSHHTLALDAHSKLIRFHQKISSEATVRVFSLTGRELFHSSEYLPQGDCSLRISTAQLSKGTYIVSVKAGENSMRCRMAIGQ